MRTKECNVVMLPIHKGDTINKTAIIKIYNRLQLTDIPETAKTMGEYWGKAEPQHLYVLSDDEIKESDWYIRGNGLLGVRKCDSTRDSSVWTGDDQFDKEDCKKIIATTDPKLLYTKEQSTKDGDLEKYHNVRTYVGMLSDAFIQKYVEEHNAGRPITKVLVEYEYITSKQPFSPPGKEVPKLAPKGHIIIHPVKELTFTVVDMKEAFKAGEKYQNDIYWTANGQDFKDWFKEKYEN